VATKKNQQEPSIEHMVRLNLEQSQSSQACTVLLLFLGDLLVVLEVNAALPINDKIPPLTAILVASLAIIAAAISKAPRS